MHGKASATIHICRQSHAGYCAASAPTATAWQSISP